MKKFLICFICTCILMCSFMVCIAMTYYEEIDFSTGLVTASALNVRTGPRQKF